MGNALDTKLLADNTTRSLNRLTSLTVARAKQPGMYADGGSLYLRVAPGGSKQWIFRYTAIDGRMRDMSLGAVHTFSLAEARERATQARKLRADGIDPLDYKRAQRAALAAANAKKIRAMRARIHQGQRGGVGQRQAPI
jgi:hypothetical protein